MSRDSKKKVSILGKILGLLIFILIVLVIVIVLKKTVFKKDDKPVKKKSEKVETIENFDYYLYDNSTDLYKKLYYELKDCLKEKEVNEEEYAKLIAELFVADFYSLDAKLTNQDVGGLDFIYSSIKENFKLNAVDTIYKYVKSNVYGDRNQDLPEVSEIVSATVTKTAYKYSKGNINILDPSAYVVNIKWSYKKSSSYQTSAKITLVHEKEDLLSIIKVQ